MSDIRRESIDTLLARPVSDQYALGYAHTAREIAQQPETWVETAQAIEAVRDDLLGSLAAADLTPGGTGSLVLTGSGSSLYVGESVAVPLQRALGLPVSAVPSGEILTDLDGWIPADRPGLLVSCARSGDSPESVAAVDEVLAARPRWQHLVITCNGAGRLATRYREEPRVRTVVLADRTCDRSLVMTSSFTNMVVAAYALGSLRALDGYRARVNLLADAGRSVLAQSGLLARLATPEPRSVIFLASGGRGGAAREAALKMLEMTGGRVPVLPETFLGLRHGPMSAVHADTLVVGFLASDPITRAYEHDVVAELNQKNLGTRLLIGAAIPSTLLRPGDAALAVPQLDGVGDDLAAAVDVLAGQLLALFQCLSFGLQPDAPSQSNVINRVVSEFAIHRRHSTERGARPHPAGAHAEPS